MAPPGDPWKYVVSIGALIAVLLIGIALGRLNLNANRCALLNQFGIHPAGCLPDLKPATAGARAGDFCRPPHVSPDAFVAIMNVGYVEAGPSSTEVVAYPANSPMPIRATVSVPAIPAGGTYTAQISNIPIATIDIPIAVTVDSSSTFNELNEDNNVLIGLCRR
jgi:hypothetical protein